MDAGDLGTRGARLHALCARLYPIVRSITGNGVRRSLELLRELIPLEVREVPSGTRVFDWTVPPEWNVEDAYVGDAQGERIVDLQDHSLHLVSYSEPVRTRLTLEELQPYLHSLPEYPEWIPYRTSYYARSWGFCLRDANRRNLGPGPYDVVIDSSLKQGSLTYGEYLIPGKRDEEILISTHICHPSLANDNLSGIAVAAFLARMIADGEAGGDYTYRFLFVPATIGAITWLARNQDCLGRIVGGFVLSGVGDPGPFTYKRSRAGNTVMDRVFARVLNERGDASRSVPFMPYGYDERQYCSPGMDLPVGCLMRTPFGTYPQYHTSADDLTFITPEALEDTLATCTAAIGEFEQARRYRNLLPDCEPQLGRRGLYEALGGDNDRHAAQMALLWMLNYSDGRHSTLDISELSGLDLESLHRAAARLCDAELMEEA